MIKFFTIFLLSALSLQQLAYSEELKGDVQAGEKKIAMCIGCHGIHGYQASFPVVYKVPKISGQTASYIVSALNAYKKGERRHPSMRAVATTLSDQDMADLAAYYQQHGHKDNVTVPAQATQAPDQVAALVQKGACTSCHGPNLNSPIVATYPKIAGQHQDYVLVALRSYQADARNVWGRNNAIMAGVAKQFTTDELKLLSKYVSEQQGELLTVSQSKFR
ncbi:MAG: c-type cytochrome [Betaproteobacteria bacterium]|jgi:cytochrome c553